MKNSEVKAKITLHSVIEIGWVHTHGMSDYGLPELEARNVPDFLAEATSQILRNICDYMVENGKQIHPGEAMELSRHTRLAFVEGTPLEGEEDHYVSQRLQIVDIEPTCECCQTK